MFCGGPLAQLRVTFLVNPQRPHSPLTVPLSGLWELPDMPMSGRPPPAWAVKR